MEKICIIIPGFNEERHIGEVIKRTKNKGFKNIIFVDDGSDDKSAKIAEKCGAIVLKHIINLGKGAAARTGCEYAIEHNFDIIILMDADGQHKPEDIPRFLNALKEKDIVFGYRKLDKKMPPIMRFGNWFINKVSEIVTGLKIKDTQSGFRCFYTKKYKKIQWNATNYSMESEMIVKVAKNKLKYTEIPIDTIYLDTFKGTTIFDGIKVVLNILKFKILGGRE
ncbi:glycosyltransferase family 2 protein [Candidatus Woesearchaeota archaeon]|nr:glycosyltransferase family 2 protein [Candidatus Woesearchaeota archaeon]